MCGDNTENTEPPFYMWPTLVVAGNLVHIGITLERRNI